VPAGRRVRRPGGGIRRALDGPGPERAVRDEPARGPHGGATGPSPGPGTADDGPRLRELLIACTEMASNSLRYGGGGGTLRMRAEGSSMICEFHRG
jgi:hypothetical protein